MHPSYFPQQLVHAHLPAPPLIPNAIPELRIPTQRHYPATSDVLGEPLHPDHAVSVVHDPITGILARSIQNGYGLELRSLSLVIHPYREKGQTGSETIRIFFPDRLRPLAEGCIVSSRRGGRVYILAVSQANVLYRLSFPLGSFKARAGDRFVFMTKGNDDWSEEWAVPDDVIVACGGVGAWTVVHEGSVALGGGDGGIVRLLRLSQGSGQWTAHHHRTTSRFRLPSLFSRNASSHEQVMSFASFGQEGHHPVLYSLSRDRKLRIWNPTNGSCLKTIEVRSASQELVPHRSQPSSSQSSSALSDNASVPLIRVIPHPSPASRYSHLLVIFFASPHSSSSAGTIDVYRVSPTNDLVYAGERPCSLASAGSHLRGFEIQPPMEKDRFDSGWTLWATWDNKGTISCESVIMDDVFQFQTHVEPQHSSRSLYDWQQASHSTEVEQFDAAYFDDLLSLDPPNPARPYDNADISSIFIHHLFYPARFSSLTLTTAFDEYILQLPKRHLIPQLSAAYPSLSKKYLAVVGCQIEMEMSPQTGAPVVQVFRRDLKLDWLGIWARVRDLDKQARWPVSTAAVEQQLVVFTREGVTASVPEDAIRVVDRLGQSSENVHDFLDLPEGSLKSLFLALTPPTARRCAVALSSVGTSMSTALARQEADEGGSGLELFNDQVNAFLAAPASQPVEALAGSLWDDMVDPYLTEQDRVNVRRLLSECPDTMRGLSESLDLLANLTFPLPGTDISDFNDSGLAKSLITSTIMAVIAARYSFARSILLVSLFHLAQSADEEAEDLIEILNRAVVTYHRYRILKWVSEQTGEEAQTRKKWKRSDKRKQNGGDDMLAEGLGGLKMREGEEEGVDMDGYDVGYSLLHSLLARRSPQTVKKGSISAIHESATSFLSATGLLRKNQVDLEPQSADVELAHRILVDGHAALAGQLSALYPLSSGMAYVRGRAYLEVGDPDSAVRCLQQAAAGCKDGSLAELLPASAGDTGLTAYYRQLTRLFSEHSVDGPVAYFGQLAIDSTAPDDPSVRDLWTKVFLANLAVASYEDAYSVLSSCPHLDLQRDFLGQLISVMCESNEVGRLNSLGFVGFQKEVEATLSFKARNSDPLRFPNYYKVLYSWHISRGDYRSAGEIMYRQGRRFAEASSGKVPGFELAAMQARSYLAAINALTLVDKRNAWVSGSPAPPRAMTGIKRRKVSTYIPEDEFSQDKGPIEIVILSDIEVEYTLVLSRLQLSSQIRDLHEHGVSVSPEEVVGLFTQRGMFDHAQSAAAALQVDMTDMIQSLAARCVELSRISNLGGDPCAATFLQMSPLTSRLRGPPSALALRYLQSTLARHDSARTHWRYRAAVAETLFEMNQDKRAGWQMPVWLVDWEMEREPEGWISRALRWGWVEEALDWSVELLRRATPPELLPPRKADVTILPYNLFDRVLAASGEGDEKDEQRVQGKAKVLREGIGRRKEGLAKVKGTS